MQHSDLTHLPDGSHHVQVDAQLLKQQAIIERSDEYNQDTARPDCKKRLQVQPLQDCMRPWHGRLRETDPCHQYSSLFALHRSAGSEVRDL